MKLSTDRLLVPTRVKVPSLSTPDAQVAGVLTQTVAPGFGHRAPWPDTVLPGMKVSLPPSDPIVTPEVLMVPKIWPLPTLSLGVTGRKAKPPFP